MFNVQKIVSSAETGRRVRNARITSKSTQILDVQRYAMCITFLGTWRRNSNLSKRSARNALTADIVRLTTKTTVLPALNARESASSAWSESEMASLS